MIKRELIIIKLSKKLITIKKIIFFSIIPITLFLFLFVDLFDTNLVLKNTFIFSLILWAVMNFISGFFISTYHEKGNLILNEYPYIYPFIVIFV